MSTVERPRCYNRSMIPVGYWVTVQTKDGKPRFRYIYFRMSIDCGAHKTFGGLQPVDPIKFNWNCSGCRWHPEALNNKPLFHNHATGGFCEA